MREVAYLSLIFTDDGTEQVSPDDPTAKSRGAGGGGMTADEPVLTLMHSFQLENTFRVTVSPCPEGIFPYDNFTGHH